MNLIIHIFYYKVLLFLKTNSPLKLSSGLKSAGTFIVYSLFAYGCYKFSYGTIQYLLETVKIGSFLLHRFILAILFIFFIAINIGNIVVSFSTLYKSKEVNYLFSKPVSFTKIFLIKFLDNFFYSSTTLLLIISAVLIGYGSYFKLGLSFYPLALIFLILPFMLTAGSLGVIILLIILRLAERWGFRKVIGSITLVYVAWIIGFYLVSSPINLVEKVFEYYPNIDQYFGFIESPVVKFFPSFWVADSLYWISKGEISGSFSLIIANIFASLFFTLLALFLAKKWYYSTWQTSLNINSQLRIKSLSNHKLFSFQSKSSFHIYNEMIIKREFWLFWRDPSQWLHFLIMLFLIGVFISSIAGIDIIIINAYNEYLKTIVYLVVMLFNIFLIASLSLRFVYPLISMEGEALWKIKSSPINPRQFLLKRLMMYFAVIFFIGQIISYFSNYQFPAKLASVAQINSALITISLISLNFGMGGIFANYKERNPIRIASSQGASITFLVTLFYLVILIAILFVPVFNFFSNSQRGIVTPVWQLLFSSAVLFALTLIMGTLFIQLGLKSFKRDV